MNPFHSSGLQLTDSFFPVGAFAYSDGLETAAASGRSMMRLAGRWMDHFLEGVFVPCEGLALVKCMLRCKRGDLETLRRIDQELTAIRPASAVRAASTGVGKRLLSLYRPFRRRGFPTMLDCLPHGNAAVAYAIVFFHRGH